MLNKLSVVIFVIVGKQFHDSFCENWAWMLGISTVALAITLRRKKDEKSLDRLGFFSWF